MIILKTILTVTLSLFLLACNTRSMREGTHNDYGETNTPGLYGAAINTQNPVSGEKLMRLLSEKDSVWVTFKSAIVTNCQRTGCWMDLDLGSDKVMKVFFKDYEFFIPLDSKGRTATVEGYATKELIDVEMLKHYAEDDGQSQEVIDAITEPELIYMFDAIGVIIED
jgi:hypothetical protein